MKEYIPINYICYDLRNTFFKPAKSDREYVQLYKCCNSENCDAYKRGRCLMLNGLFGQRCPYGIIEKEQGFTKTSKKCGKIVDTYNSKYDDIKRKLDSLRFVCRIGDYVYLNLPFLSNYVNPIRDNEFFVSDQLIHSKDFTPEFIVELLKFHPRSLMGDDIIDYQIVHIPMFSIQLKRYMPDIYKEVEKIYPDINKYIESVNYIGKEAYIKTLQPGKVKISSKEFDWDGKYIIGKCKDVLLFGLKDEIFTITPNENTIVGIVDNDTVTEDTIFNE